MTKIIYSIVSAFSFAGFLYLWSVSTDRTAAAMAYASTLFLILSLAYMLMSAETSHYNSVTAYIEALVKMDTELRNALAFTVPSLHLIAKRGTVKTLFADTKATDEHIRLFLQDSNAYHTASRRDWRTAERPAWAYDEIYKYLIDSKKISSYAVGPESYPWIGTAFHSMCALFLSRDLEEMPSPTE